MVRGVALKGPLKHYRELEGRDGRAALIRSLPAEIRAVFESRIDDRALYPYAAFTTLLREIDQRCGDGDLRYCEVLGRDAAMAEMGAVFRAFVAIGSPEQLIRGCREVWESYYSVGSMRATAWRPNATRVRIEGFPEIDPAHCWMMRGWMNGALAAVGVHVHAGGEETHCAARGDEYCEFACSWNEVLPSKRPTVRLEPVDDRLS